MIGIDMKMPTNCGKCRFASAFECIINCEFIPNHDKKSAHCPLTVLDRPQGEWKTVEGYDGDEYYECTNCGEPWFLSAGTPKDNNMNFCPNCGADMRGEDNEKSN